MIESNSRAGSSKTIAVGENLQVLTTGVGTVLSPTCVIALTFSASQQGRCCYPFSRKT